MNVKLGALPTIALALSLAYSSGAGAQVGSTTDILMGRVAGLDSQGVAGARVEATSVESGITRTKTTGPDGRYTIIFPDGGGTYRLTVRALGMAPVTRKQFNNAIGRGPGGGRMNPEALKARMTRLVPNAFLDIIAINDSAKLELTPDQIAKLQASGDAFKVRADSLIDKVANILGDTTIKSPDPMTVFSKLQPSMTEGRKLAVQAINDAKAILTPAQWAKVPEGIKTPGLRRGDGEGGRFERGGPGNG